MNTEPKLPTEHSVDRLENYCETVKIIKDLTKIEKVLSNNSKYSYLFFNKCFT